MIFAIFTVFTAMSFSRLNGCHFLGKIPDNMKGKKPDPKLKSKNVFRIVSFKHSGYLATTTALGKASAKHLLFSSKYEVGPHAKYHIQCLHDYVNCVLHSDAFSQLVKELEANNIVIGFEVINTKLGQHAGRPNQPYFVVTTAFQDTAKGTIEWDKIRLAEFCAKYALPMAECWLIEGTADIYAIYEKVKYADFEYACETLDVEPGVNAQEFRPHKFQGPTLEGVIVGDYWCDDPNEYMMAYRNALSKYNEALAQYIPKIEDFFAGINDNPKLNGIINGTDHPDVFITVDDVKVRVEMPLKIQKKSVDALNYYLKLYDEVVSEEPKDSEGSKEAQKQILLIQKLIPMADSGKLTVSSYDFVSYDDPNKVMTVGLLKLDNDGHFLSVNQEDAGTDRNCAMLFRNHMLIPPTKVCNTLGYVPPYLKLWQEKLKFLPYFFIIAIFRNAKNILIRGDIDEILSLLSNFFTYRNISVDYRKGITVITHLYAKFIASLSPDIVDVRNFKINFLQIIEDFFRSIDIESVKDLMSALLNPHKLPGASEELVHSSQLNVLILILSKSIILKLCPPKPVIKPVPVIDPSKPPKEKKVKKVKEIKAETDLSNSQQELLDEFLKRSYSFKLKIHEPNSGVFPGNIYLMSNPPPPHMCERATVLDPFGIMPSQWYESHPENNVVRSTSIEELDVLLRPIVDLQPVKYVNVFVVIETTPGTGKTTFFDPVSKLDGWHIFSSDYTKNMPDAVRGLVERVLILEGKTTLNIAIDKNFPNGEALDWLISMLKYATQGVPVKINFCGIRPQQLNIAENISRVLQRSGSTHPLSIERLMKENDLTREGAIKEITKIIRKFGTLVQAKNNRINELKFLETNIFYEKMSEAEYNECVVQLIEYAFSHKVPLTQILYGDEDGDTGSQKYVTKKIYARIVFHESTDHCTIFHPGYVPTKEEEAYVLSIAGASVACYSGMNYQCESKGDSSVKVSFMTIINESFTGFDPSRISARNYHVTSQKSLVGCLPSMAAKILNDIDGASADFDIEKTPIDMQLNGVVVISYL